jgi:hypothetical protein
MKKANGWGLRFELVFIMIFLICLLVATIGLNKLGLLGDNDDNYNNKVYFSYTVLENKLNDASKRYYQNNYDEYNPTDLTIRSYTLLSNNYMNELLDEEGNKCSGYTSVKHKATGIEFKSFINCPKYTTEGYLYE